MRVFWNGGSGDFALAGNWSPASVPDSSDRVFLRNGIAPYGIDIYSAASGRRIAALTAGITCSAISSMERRPSAGSVQSLPQ